MDVHGFLAAQHLTALCLGNHLEPALELCLAAASAVEAKQPVFSSQELWRIDDGLWKGGQSHIFPRTLNLELLTPMEALLSSPWGNTLGDFGPTFLCFLLIFKV